MSDSSSVARVESFCDCDGSYDGKCFCSYPRKQENRDACTAYSGRGRTDEVKACLASMGFDDLKNCTPDPCFERYARERIKKNQSLVTVAEIAKATREDDSFQYLDDDIKELDDKSLVKAMLSGGESFYYSLCLNSCNKAIAGGTVRFAKSVGAGENGTAKVATNANGASPFRVTTVLPKRMKLGSIGTINESSMY